LESFTTTPFLGATTSHLAFKSERDYSMYKSREKHCIKSSYFLYKNYKGHHKPSIMDKGFYGDGNAGKKIISTLLKYDK